MQFLTEAGERALEEAASAIEAVSSVEVVIAIRSRARYSLVQHAVVAFVTAFAMLAFMLYGPVHAARWQVLVVPIVAAFAGAMLVEAAPPLHRWLAPTWQRYDHVREAAYAVFVEKAVHRTRERTGLLVYIALREGMVELVGDLGVLQHHGIEELAAWAGSLEARLSSGAEAVAKELAALAPALAASLPRRHDDTNELADKPLVVDARVPQS
jgi:putative membrane protein